MALFCWRFLLIFVIFFIKDGWVQVCPNNRFPCSSNCAPLLHRCNGFPTCNGNVDELGSDGDCTDDEYQCDSGACIPSYMKCNRKIECAGHDDEANCTVTEGCRYHQFQCWPSGTCALNQYMCSSVVCQGDERRPCDGQCEADEFACNNGACIPNYYRCDKVDDCENGDDEIDCDESQIEVDSDGCTGHQIKCDAGHCASIDFACTSNPGCLPDFESSCFGGCAPDEYECRSGYCLPQKYVCDGFHDCADYDDDEANCNPAGSMITANCTANEVSASFPGSFVRSLLPLAGDLLALVGDDLTPLNNCFAVFDNQTDQYNILFQDGIQQCSANTNSSDTEIVVTYKVLLGDSSSQIITRTQELSVVEFECSYLRTGLVTLDQPLLAIISHVEVDLGKTSSSFTMEMARYTSDSFATVEIEQAITIGSPVYIGVKIDVGSDTNMVLQGMFCHVAPAENETENFYPVIIGGCTIPDPLDADGNVIYNLTDTREFGFSFLGFSWTGVQDAEQELWITCNMNICKTTESNDCEIVCPPMEPMAPPAKRSITGENNDAEKKISLGPFLIAPNVVSDDKLACDKDKLECSYKCGVDSVGVAYCFCPEGRFLNEDGKTCVEVNLGTETLWEVSLISCYGLLMLTLILAAFVVLRRKNVKKMEI